MPTRTKTPKGRVLVVEDNQFTLRLLGDLLEHWNVTMYSAPSAAAAHAAMDLHGDDFQLALVDRLLPDGDGRDVCVALRARRPSLPIIQMSGLPLADGDLTVVNGTLSKPFDVDALLCIVLAFTQQASAEL